MSNSDNVLEELTRLHALGPEVDEPPPAPPPPALVASPSPVVERASNRAVGGAIGKAIAALDTIAAGFGDLRAALVEAQAALGGEAVEATSVPAAVPSSPRPMRRAVKAELPPDPPEVARELPPTVPTPVRRPSSAVQRQIAERRARAYASAAPGSLPIPVVDPNAPEVTIEDTDTLPPGVTEEDRADVAALTGMRRPAPSTPEAAEAERRTAAERRLAEVNPESDFSDWTLDESRPHGRAQGASNGATVPTA